jgi:predicted PurR-regulated permease PerM
MWPGASPQSTIMAAASLMITAIVVGGLYLGRDILMPLALAGLLSFVLSPLVKRLVRIGVPRGIAVSVVILLLLLLIGVSIWLLGKQAATLAESLPAYRENLSHKINLAREFLGSGGIWSKAFQVLSDLQAQLNPEPAASDRALEVKPASQPLSAALAYFSASLPTLGTLVLVVILTTFILLQYEDIRDRSVRLMGVQEIGRSTQALDDVGKDLARFFLLQASLNATFGVAIGATLWVIGVPGAILWGFLAAAMRFVPYVGSILAAFFPMVAAALFDSGWTMLVETTVLFLVSESLVGQVIEPLLFGHRTSLSPLAVVASAAFWTFLWGPLGLLIATPLTLTIVVLGHHVPALNFISVILGNEPPLERPVQLYHQLLLADVARASRDAETWIGERSAIEYVDTVVLPALAAAAFDQRRGILEGHTLERIAQGTQEFTDTFGELIPEPVEEKMGPRGARPVLALIGARGLFDQAAASVMADMAVRETDFDVSRVAMPGLNGVSSLLSEEVKPDVVAVVATGGETPGQLRLVVRKLRRSFPQAALYVLAADAEGEVAAQPDRYEGATVTQNGADFLDVLRRCFHHLRAKAEPDQEVPVPAPVH